MLVSHWFYTSKPNLLTLCGLLLMEEALQFATGAPKPVAQQFFIPLAFPGSQAICAWWELLLSYCMHWPRWGSWRSFPLSRNEHGIKRMLHSTAGPPFYFLLFPTSSHFINYFDRLAIQQTRFKRTNQINSST